MRFFTGCTHFSHANIIRFCSRPFVDAIEMDRVLIEKWNTVVSDEDTVFHLGDFSFAMFNKAQEVFNKLNGKKYMVKGNHDSSPKIMKMIGFKECYPNLQIDIGGTKVNLNHHPYREYVNKYDLKFQPQMPVNDGNWLLHCHIHNGLESWKIRDKQINCTVEYWDYSPIPEEAIAQIIYGAK
jgi:calcineurin-like phosphoesterase family protein